jgi:hypothetical protein
VLKKISSVITQQTKNTIGVANSRIFVMSALNFDLPG